MTDKDKLVRQATKEAMLELIRSTDSLEQMAGAWGIVFQHCVSLGMNNNAETGEQAVLDFIDDLYQKASKHDN